MNENLCTLNIAHTAVEAAWEIERASMSIH